MSTIIDCIKVFPLILDTVSVEDYIMSSSFYSRPKQLLLCYCFWGYTKIYFHTQRNTFLPQDVYGCVCEKSNDLDAFHYFLVM